MDRVEQMQLQTEDRPGSLAKVSVELGDCAFQEMRRFYVVGPHDYHLEACRSGEPVVNLLCHQRPWSDEPLVVKVALVLKIGDAIHHGAPRKKGRDTELVDFQYDGAVGWGVLRRCAHVDDERALFRIALFEVETAG